MNIMNQDQLKAMLGEYAAHYIDKYLTTESYVGVGTGSTANYFIDALGQVKHRFAGAVASSNASAERLKQHGIAVLELTQVDELVVYVDGADEIDPQLAMIKGGGGALTREKIVASAARQFICIADHSKWVIRLGHFPLPVEVIPMARSVVGRALAGLGGKPTYRQDFSTDNGNIILDVSELNMNSATAMETAINQIPGVVSNGLFALQGADVLLMDKGNEIQEITARQT
jgi:ribose 5-phosphate isomerase A